MLSIPMLSCAASFDCFKASTTTEKLICGDKTVSGLDEQLAVSYKAALEKETNKDSVKKVQIEWLKRQRTCKDVECLTKVYQARIDDLSGDIINSCYTFTQEIKDISSSKEEYYPATSFLKIIDKDKDKITFELKQFGGNFHVCLVAGFAFVSADGNGDYIFRDEKKYWNGGLESYGSSHGEETCEIKISTYSDEVKVFSKGSCQGFCGARAGIGGEVMKKSNRCSSLKF